MENETSNSMGALSRIIQWMVVGSLALLFIPMYLASTTIKEAQLPLKDELATLEAPTAETVNPEEDALSATLIQVRQETVALEAFQVSGYINWPDVMIGLSVYDPALMTITAISQTTPRITISGTADDEPIVMAYAETLKSTPLFSAVEMQSIMRQPPATPDPTGTVTAGKPVSFTLLVEVKNE